MPPHDKLLALQQAIQLSIAPVFLLTGIAALLGVMSTRLARIIDRATDLERRREELEGDPAEAEERELSCLESRRGLASWAISFCTGAALLVCLVIVTLFVGEFVRADLTLVAAAQFVLAMFALIGGLTSFFLEVYSATRASRIQINIGRTFVIRARAAPRSKPVLLASESTRTVHTPASSANQLP